MEQKFQRSQSSKGLKIALIITTLLFVGLAVFAGYLYMSKQDSDAKRDELSQDVASLKTQLDSDKTKNNTTPEIEATPQQKTDTEKIIDVAKLYRAASNSSLEETYQVALLQPPFARLSVSTQGSGHSCIFKKSGDTWLRLYCAQGSSPENEMINKEYNVPAAILQ